MIKTESNIFSATLTPTLGTGKIFLTIDNSSQVRTFSYRIVSVLGQVFQVKNMKAESGTNSFPITINSPDGIYYLQIVSSGFVESIPFVISTGL